MTKKTTVDAKEIAKFAQHANQWWDKDGPLKTLHDINPVRIQFIETITNLSHKSILDVGCGGGILAEGLVKNGALVTGLDVEPDAIAAAKAHAFEQHLKINYICQPIEEYKGELFDCITCMEMLEHVADPQFVLEQCKRLLKPGGYLFLSTISRTIKAYTSVIVAAEYVLGLLPRQTHDFDKFINVSELAAMVRATGLEMIGLSGMNYNPLFRTAYLKETTDVNYLMACQKGES